MPVLTVTLNPAIDKLIEIKNSPASHGLKTQKISLSAGGKGLNVSRALKCFGLKSIATGLLGGASGEFIHRKLNKENLKNNFLFIACQTRTNLTVLDPTKNKISRVMERGPVVSQTEFNKFKRKFAALLSGCNAVVFSGSAPRGLPASCYRDLILLAKKKNVKTFLDTSGRPLQEGLRAKPFFIKPNLEEAQALLGRRLNSAGALKKAIKYFHHFGVEIVVISMGEKGGVASNGKIILAATPPHLPCVNNVGCGDVLTAGFVWAITRGMNFNDAVSFAFAAATASMLSTVPGHIKKGFIKKAKPKINRL